MFNRMSFWLDSILAIVSGILIIALLFSVTTGIVTRAAGRPQVWTDEAASYLMVWLAMFGWMVATRRAAHIRIRFFNDMVPRPQRRLLEVVFLLAAVAVGLIVAVQATHLAAASWDVDAITLPVTTAWLYLPLIPAGLVTAGQAFSDLIALWRLAGLTATEGATS